MPSYSIATVCLSGRLDAKLRAAADVGFQQVEIMEADLIAYDGAPRDIGRMCRDLGLEICCYQPFRDFEGMTGAQRAANFRRAERKFELMAELGTDLLLVCSNVSPASVGGIDRSAADFRELGELAARHGMRVGYEALAWGRHVSDYRDAWEVVRRADHARVGLVLDSFHALARRTPIDAIRSIPGDRIFLVQLADAPDYQLDVLSWSRHFRCFPGQGDLPVTDFMRAVQDTGYAGPWSLEIFNDQFRASSTARVARDGLRSLVDLADKLQLEKLPPLSPQNGFSFLEFAVDAASATRLETLLQGLGFVRSGRHKSKAVDRWTQGEINLVVNTEKTGFAYSHFVTHGPGVCVVGLETQDPQAVLERGRALKAAPYSGHVNPGEAAVPTLAGVGGALVSLLPPSSAGADIWRDEFSALEPSAPAGQLRAIDHIAQTMHSDEMLSWLLFYETIFGLERLSLQEIADPGGLVQSRAVASADDRVRIVLNGSNASATQSARFVQEFFGSGVQHIAFATDDIFSTVAAMRQKGVAFLEIPANYYDDLDARFALSPETLAAMRDNRILYDRDQNGAFFQIYTQTFEGRFFFEIVQRDAYRGFGAPNAPVRLSAQTRELPAGMPRH
ncbi:MAG: sugar phosphate isomerase/epimerase and 4-hydroxyphenylpyruvate domain-containing protein [Hyphomicrobiales bacterium]|nr:sugar phosphate isomerase/epimerase and 4-hydroxyphenylpyruvate domain-containing protein [Hyphomicrobiales bacterium]